MFRFHVSPPRQEFFISSNRSKVTNMNQNELKKAVAQEAVKYVKPNSVLGVGTGSTVNCFIDALAPIKDQIKAAVSSSEATTARLKDLGIKVISLNDVDHLDIYIDGADEMVYFFKILLPEARPSIVNGVTLTIINLIGYSAMAGLVGGGGIGNLAIQYGYYRYETGVMIVTVIILVVLVQLGQSLGDFLAKKVTRK